MNYEWYEFKLWSNKDTEEDTCSWWSMGVYTLDIQINTK